MKIMVAIEVDYEDSELLERHLREAQAESDGYADEEPDDYSPGFGTLTLGTEDVSIAARIAGILEPRNAPHHRERYAIRKV